MGLVIQLPKPKKAKPLATADADRLPKSERDAALLFGLLPPGSEEMAISEPPHATGLDGRERR